MYNDILKHHFTVFLLLLLLSKHIHVCASVQAEGCCSWTLEGRFCIHQTGFCDIINQPIVVQYASYTRVMVKQEAHIARMDFSGKKETSCVQQLKLCNMKYLQIHRLWSFN